MILERQKTGTTRFVAPKTIAEGDVERINMGASVNPSDPEGGRVNINLNRYNNGNDYNYSLNLSRDEAVTFGRRVLTQVAACDRMKADAAKNGYNPLPQPIDAKSYLEGVLVKIAEWRDDEDAWGGAACDIFDDIEAQLPGLIGKL